MEMTCRVLTAEAVSKSPEVEDYTWGLLISMRLMKKRKFYDGFVRTGNQNYLPHRRSVLAVNN